jgi:hypothetical protein
MNTGIASKDDYSGGLAFLDKAYKIIAILPVKPGSDHSQRVLVADKYKIEGAKYYIILHATGEYFVGMNIEGTQWLDFNRNDFSFKRIWSEFKDGEWQNSHINKTQL